MHDCFLWVGTTRLAIKLEELKGGESLHLMMQCFQAQEYL